MYQAITTRYLGPTNHRGSRIVAKAEAGKITVPYDHALDVGQNHLAAAQAFATKWGWSGIWAGGGADNGYAFVRLRGFSDSAVILAEERDERGRSWFAVD